MFKKSLLTLLLAALLAALVAMISDRRGFGELAVRAAIADQAGVQSTKCPLSPEQIDKADIGLLSICVNFGLAAYDAAQRYPLTAAKIFAVYGNEEIFQEVLDRYGHQVIPVIEFFVENGSRELQIRQALGNAVHEIWAGKKPKWEPADITREQVGLIAIYRLAARGHEMLAEFEIIDGIAKRKPMTRLILGMKDLLLGGVEDIETILVRGQRLPTWKEVGLAALDLTIVAGGVGAVAKAARLGVDAAGVVEKSTLRLAAEGAYEAISAVGKTGVLVTPIAFAYVAITRPQLIASAGGWIAEQIGVNRTFGIFAVYLVGIFLLLQLLRPLLWCGRTLVMPIYRLFRCAYSRGVL
jgi:hypothetical protein